MTGANRSIGVMVGCVVLIGATRVVAQDWPQWRGPNRDGKVAGFTAPETWPEALAEKWKTTVGSGDATPALVGDKLYVFARQGDDEVTLCLDAGDGRKLWQDKYAAQAVTGAAARHPGPRSSPAVADGKVVTLGVGGVLSCLDAATGKVVWRKDPFPKVVPMFFTAMSPIIVDGWPSRISAGGQWGDHRLRPGQRRREVAMGRRRPRVRLARPVDRGRHEADRDADGEEHRGRRRGRRKAPVAASVRARRGGPTTPPRRSSTGKR